MENKKIFWLGIFASCIFASSNAFAEGFFHAAKEAGLGASVSLGAVFTDNRDQKGETEEENDIDFTIGLKLSYERIFENRYKFYFDYSPTYVVHNDPAPGSEKDAFEHAVNAKLELTPGRRTLLRFTERFWWSGNKDWNFDDNFLEDRNLSPDDFNDNYIENRLAGHMQYNFSEKNYMLLDAFARNRRYDNDSNYDEDEYNVRLAIMRSPTRYYSLGFYGDYTSFNRDNRVYDYDHGVDYVTFGVQTTIDFFADQRWVVNASTGYNFMFYDDDRMNDTSMFGDSRLELAIHQRELLRGKIGVRYSKDYSSVLNYSSERNFVTFGSISRIFGRNNSYTVGADVEFRLRNFDKDDVPSVVQISRGNEERDTFYLKLYLNTRITEGLNASFFYSYEDCDSDIKEYPYYDYQENVFGVRLTYNFL